MNSDGGSSSDGAVSHEGATGADLDVSADAPSSADVSAEKEDDASIQGDVGSQAPDGTAATADSGLHVDLPTERRCSMPRRRWTPERGTPVAVVSADAATVDGGVVDSAVADSAADGAPQRMVRSTRPPQRTARSSPGPAPTPPRATRATPAPTRSSLARAITPDKFRSDTRRTTVSRVAPPRMGYPPDRVYAVPVGIGQRLTSPDTRWLLRLDAWHLCWTGIELRLQMHRRDRLPICEAPKGSPSSTGSAPTFSTSWWGPTPIREPFRSTRPSTRHCPATFARRQ